ncbi:hypothetical protein MFIFM68171_06270 [Madurella fahalii]|uniref:Aminoglycoside phosphotransferase domain-containing protein n=1 Tax=Madurella fahalii TaxID=1157608 RepID=A0ABQ0GEE9_9PEZI
MATLTPVLVAPPDNKMPTKKHAPRHCRHILDERMAIKWIVLDRLRLCGEAERVVDTLESAEGKVGWCIHDVHFMNVLVKNDPKEGESKIVLIDFEFIMRKYRALDIGGHFMQKMFKWSDNQSKIADCRKYTEEEKTHFHDGYARRWNKTDCKKKKRARWAAVANAIAAAEGVPDAK